MKRPIFFIAILFLTVIGLSVIHVSVANSLSTTGITLSKMQEEIKSYKKENTQLKEHILQASSLMNVNEKAKLAGYTNIKTQVSISQPLPIARR